MHCEHTQAGKSGAGGLKIGTDAVVARRSRSALTSLPDPSADAAVKQVHRHRDDAQSRTHALCRMWPSRLIPGSLCKRTAGACDVPRTQG